MLCQGVRNMYGRHHHPGHGGGPTSRGSLGVLPKPPKPPSWRDFDQRQNGAKSLDFTDINRVELDPARHSHVRSSHTKPKRTKAKIHRTQSQLTIHEEEIPAVGVTVTLAETNPKEIGLRKKYYSDEKLYFRQNNARCKEWLEGVKACEPLEDVSFSQGVGVEVEVPEESSAWTNLHSVRQSNSTSSEGEPPDGGGGPNTVPPETSGVINKISCHGNSVNSKRSKLLEKARSPRQGLYKPSCSSAIVEDLETYESDSKMDEGVREVNVSPRSAEQGSTDAVQEMSPRSGCLSTTALGSVSTDLPRVEVHSGFS